ncbi:MAG: aminotransferase class V-fold PLP-dependent enzyme [Vicinamibacteria bacterium]|nr:aminotransferase class V-fold PLP-dependent enzyme [Vicinamibacteria bacterium]
MNAADWEDLRRDFPALADNVYLNSAAAGPTPRPVREAVHAYYRELEEGGDRSWDAWLERREQIRSEVAAFVGADDDEIAFVNNTSEGMNVLADLLAADGGVLTNELEFPTVTLPWVHRGAAVHFQPAIEGLVLPDLYTEAQSPRSTTLLLSHVQFSNGCRQDLARFGAIKGDRRFVVCASQSAGAFPIDVGRDDVDALACSGHKWLCAGYGAGFLHVSRALWAHHAPRAVGWLSMQDPFRFDNHNVRLLPSARRFELGCPAFAGIFALGAALRYLQAIGIGAIATRVLEINAYLVARLQAKGFDVLSPQGEHQSGQTLVAVAEPERAVAFLAERSVMVTPKPEGLRIATHFFNNEEDVDACVRALLEYRSGGLL